MVGKCVYCKTEISDDRAVEVCNRCGIMVWGERMFKTILQNMGEAKQKDDLCNTNLDPSKIY